MKTSFSIHLYIPLAGLYKDHWIPLVYVLCTNKKQKTYEKILTILKGMESNLNPTNVILDFEKAAINAVQTVFDGSNVRCCFFHFTQNVWRHVQDVGLQSIYSDNIDFAIHIKMLMALALVPVEDVVSVFETLAESPFWQDNPAAEFNKEKQSLLNYIESTYIGSPGRTSNSKRREPLFPIAHWNMYQFTLDGKIKFICVLNISQTTICFECVIFRSPTNQQLHRRVAQQNYVLHWSCTS